MTEPSIRFKDNAGFMRKINAPHFLDIAGKMCYNISEKVCLQGLFHAIFQQKRRFGEDKARGNGSCRQNFNLSRFDVIIKEETCLQGFPSAIFQRKRRFGEDKARGNDSCQYNIIGIIP